jgi:pyridoxine 5-phosphate synthase
MFLKDFETGFEKMSSQKIRYHAGHGLTDQSVMPLLNQGLFEEYNIGHWIVSEAVFSGLYSVVKKLKDQFNVTHDFRQRRTT